MFRRSTSSVCMLAASVAVSCQTVGPDGLWSSLPAAQTVEAGAGDLAAPGNEIPIPASCHVAASSVAPTPRVEVPAGAFEMGCNAKVDTACSRDEVPEHTVDLDPFLIDETEVTQAQYALCVQAGKCGAPYCPWNPCTSPNLPIACVDREEAIDYCAYVGEVLPTEAQWEKAARGTDGRVYPWGNDVPGCELANIYGCGSGTRDVGTLPQGASPYGALDMAGNVVEWTLDVYDATYYATGPTEDPRGPAATPASSYVGRGGGWRSDAQWQRTSARDTYDPLYIKDSMGFRCASPGGGGG